VYIAGGRSVGRLVNYRGKTISVKGHVALSLWRHLPQKLILQRVHQPILL
jgi:hypothetical protein